MPNSTIPSDRKALLHAIPNATPIPNLRYSAFLRVCFRIRLPRATPLPRARAAPLRIDRTPRSRKKPRTGHLVQVGAWNILVACRLRDVIEKHLRHALVVGDYRQAPIRVRVVVFVDELGHRGRGSDKLSVGIPQRFPSFFCPDEPLTSACSHLNVQNPIFLCKSDPSIRLFSSRVHDGIPDCPDGSDEIYESH